MTLNDNFIIILKKQENKNWSKYLNIFQCFGFLLTGELYKQFIHAMAVPVSDKYWIAKVTKKNPRRNQIEVVMKLSGGNITSWTKKNKSNKQSVLYPYVTNSVNLKGQWHMISALFALREINFN